MNEERDRRNVTLASAGFGNDRDHAIGCAVMRSLALITISTLGRYPVLFLVPPVALAVWASSLVFTESLWWMIGLGIPVLLAVLATLVLVLGILLAGSTPPAGVRSQERRPPEIWDYWDKASPLTSGMRRQIVITEDINAAMHERPRIAGLFGRDQTLLIGLGLLILLDRPAVEAVLQHEFAHADLKHSNGLTKLNEFIRTLETFDEDVEDNPTMEAFVLALGFEVLNTWLQKEYLLRSRQHEFEADRQSADRLGTDIEARSNLLLDGGTHLANKLIFEPLEKELRGAVSAPKPPLRRMIEQHASLIDPDALKQALAEVMAEDPDPDSTHPPLKERLANIGADTETEIMPAGASALDAMLPAATGEKLLAEFNRDWSATINEHISIY